ncbi:PHD-finger_domain-containing protein [Hexamita inflata]|uniref:PHD-finger domain-containing protein n=1 Tax=Hexamita inflata TaxID=28002 RepID=A0AA86NN01_9EUKA|nr:PHD-finger domain-containing protein [Hexamita inflata]
MKWKHEYSTIQKVKYIFINSTSKTRKYQNKPTAAQTRLIELAGATQFFIIQQPGATSFVIQDQIKNKFKVNLGSLHTCSCTSENYCVHIAFVLLKRFKVQQDNPLVFQMGLVNAEIEKLLKGPPKSPPRKRSVSQPNTPRKRQNEITDDMYCPVCLDVFGDCVDTQFCAKCGNSVHNNCLYLYLQHARESNSNQTCPYCRAPWESGKCTEAPKNSCSSCSQPLDSAPIREKFNPDKKFCQFCFLGLKQSSFLINNRLIIPSKIKLNAPTQRQTIIQHLMNREITQSDYHLLSELDNPRADARQIILKMPGFLVPNCFKTSTLDLKKCSLCLNKEINLSNLVSQDQAFEGIMVDYQMLKEQLKQQNEVKYSVEELKNSQLQNKQRFYCCGQHVAHEFCLLLCSVQKSPVYVKEQFLQLKIVPDFCDECKIPFLKEWVRDAKLADAPKENRSESPIKAEKKQISSARKQQPAPIQSMQIDLSGCFKISLPKVLK